MRTIESQKSKDVLDLTKQGLSTFYNIAQMARYKYLYACGKELQNDDSIPDINKLYQNRVNLIKYTCLAGLGLFGLFAIGISGLKNVSK